MKYNKAEDISRNFCIMPWIGVATDPRGGVHPCCWMDPDKKYMFNGDVKDYQNSDYLSSYKESFLKGEWPEACKRCEVNEVNGLNSKRIRENYLWQNNNKGNWNELPTDFSLIDLRLSNVCNLGCISCIPKSSSFITKEIEKHGVENFPKHFKSNYNHIKDIDLLNPYTDTDIDQLTDIISKDSRIYITGGEPSLIKKVSKLLHVLRDKGYNKTVKLEFNSNFQAFNQDWVDLLKDFRGEMWPSLDGIGPLAEYVRYPCNWNKVEANLKQFVKECPHWDIRIMPTVSTLSIFGLLDLHEWVFNELITDMRQATFGKIRISLNNRLFSPSYLDIRNLPNSLKELAKKDLEIINEKYGKYETKFKYIDTVISHLDVPQELDFRETINSLETLDKVRKTDWKTVFPIIYENTKDL